MRPAARELSLLLRNHPWLPLAYQSHRTWLPRTSGTGCDLPPQPLLLLTLASKLLTALKATLCLCPAAPPPGVPRPLPSGCEARLQWPLIREAASDPPSPGVLPSTLARVFPRLA